MLIEIVCTIIALILVALAIFFEAIRRVVPKVICIILAILLVFFAAYTYKTKNDVKECKEVYSQIERIDKIGIHNYKVETSKTINDLYNKYQIPNDTYNDDFNYHITKMQKEYDEENKKEEKDRNAKKLQEITDVIHNTKVRAQNIENFKLYLKVTQNQYKKNVDSINFAVYSFFTYYSLFLLLFALFYLIYVLVQI